MMLQLKQATKFRLYNPVRYLSDLAYLTIANASSGQQFSASNPLSLRVLLASDNSGYTSEQQLSPFFAYRKELRHEFRLAFNHMLVQDVLNLPALIVRSYDLILVKLGFWTPADDAKRILQQLHKMKGNAKLVYFDGDDDACIQWSEELCYVDLYVKKHVFTDFAQYQKLFIGKSNLTDYVARNWDVSFSDDIISRSKTVDPTYFDKIFLGYNIGLDDKIRDLYKQDLGNWPIDKDNDILCRATVPDNSWMYYLRKDVTPKLQAMTPKYRVLLPNQRVAQKEYYKELLRSKICVSPFGYGEICWRDFEAVLCRCLLVKPDMSHIKTEPDIFVPYKTYVPVKWDYSDLEEKCSHYLERDDEREQIVAQAYEVLSDYYRNKKFVSKFRDMLGVLKIGAEATLSN
ncbi:MAG: glycosyltransferase family 1 protein [Chroococcidiopsidaceae cyanobacterium CP_BM_RX_35]|nr:glycosyltransferase family 1 protein [Chroococcidiopsidaceae cyanobacterium CP_BM_RX_35]